MYSMQTACLRSEGRPQENVSDVVIENCIFTVKKVALILLVNNTEKPLPLGIITLGHSEAGSGGPLQQRAGRVPTPPVSI